MRSLSWSITTFRLRMNRRPEASAPALRAGLRPSPASCVGVEQRRLQPLPWVATRIDFGIGERGRTAPGRGELTIDLRAGLDLFAAREIGEQGGEALRGQVLVVVEIDLRDRRIHAGAEALDLDPRQLAVRGDVTLLAYLVVAEL